MPARKTLLYTLFLACVLVAADQYTKYWGGEHLLVYAEPSDTHLYQGSRQPIWELGNVSGQSGTSWLQFQWNYVRNHGAAWGVLSAVSEQARMAIFQLGTLILCGGLLFLALQSRWAMPILSRSAILIIVAGALSNLFDRVALGFVVDVFDLRWQVGTFSYAFPAFNVADGLIVAGLLVATFAEFFSRSDRV